MFFTRQLQDSLVSDLRHSGKVMLLYGPRQAGKTTLSKEVIERLGYKTLQINADQLKFIEILSSRDLTRLKLLVSGYEMVFIDEGQRVPEIGINLKILHDELPDLKILVTGSSSFLLSGRVTEALTGRKKVYTLLPLAIQELKNHFTPFEINDQLPQLLVYGSYPEVLTTPSGASKAELLHEITTSYLYKDIMELESIRYPAKVRELLMLLAHQIGSQVSINELCKSVGLNRETVERYLFLLEQSFVIFRLGAYSRNLRNEINKSQKFYFYDTGVRNILIDNLRPLESRNDAGALWENFVISERIKKQHNNRLIRKNYFWRTYSGAEIDFIEEAEGVISAFEVKKNKPRAYPPKAWSESYGSEYHCITMDNYPDYL